jgi:hypothetical protein
MTPDGKAVSANSDSENGSAAEIIETGLLSGTHFENLLPRSQ